MLPGMAMAAKCLFFAAMLDCKVKDGTKDFEKKKRESVPSTFSYRSARKTCKHFLPQHQCVLARGKEEYI